MHASADMVQLSVDLGKMGYGKATEVHAVVNEGDSIPADGIEFDLPPELVPKATKSLLNSIRRLHVNCGHPPSADLARILRLSGGSAIV